jgi:hypothetical protein
MAEMQAAIDKAIADEREEWLRDTGRPMPMNAGQLVIEALATGMSREELAQADDRAQKTGDRFGYEEVKQQSTVAKILRDQHIADEITVQVAVAERVAVAKPADSPHEKKQVGPPEHEDDELEAFLLKSWTSYRDDPNIVDKDSKDEWLETLPTVREVLDPEAKQAIKDKYLRLLRNTYVRHKRKENALRPVTPRT